MSDLSFSPTRATVVMGIGGALAVLGGLLPWISVLGFGVSGAQLGGPAFVVMALGLGCLVGAGVFALDRRRFAVAWIVVSILGVVGLGTMLVNLYDIYRVSQLGLDLMSILGVGFWVALAGPAVALVGALLARNEVAVPVSAEAEPTARTSIRDLIAQTEIDLRLFGMLLALALILLTFNIASGGKFFQPTNMVTLVVQASGVAIIATGMVLVIVSRNIDLSVGSLVGLIAMAYALLMTNWLQSIFGIGPDFPFRWAIALGLGMGLGALVGAFQGFIIAYVGVPSFIVTLGGLLSIRGAIWYLSNGAAVSGLDSDFQLIGGGALGSVGGTVTWILGLVGCLAIVALLINGRRQRRRYGFPVRPVWAEVLLGIIGSAAVLGITAFANANYWPQGLANRYAAEHNITVPPGGLQISTGFPDPIMLLVGVTLVMTWIATRRKFGRYVFAYGGNPDAAELAGINTRRTILKTYVLMGVLCALAAAIAAARLNAATLDVGQSYELYVIAAAVVGGTSFAGGIGTIPGAVLGAFVMQSLAYGLGFIGVASPGQNVVAGIVLILAVGVDAFNRRRGT